MFQPGDWIVYGSCGVCRVEAVGAMACSIAAPDRLYYTLQPLLGTEVIYTPVDTKVFMRPVLRRAQAQQLIEQIPSIREEARMERSLTLLKEHYEAYFASHTCEDLVQLIKSVYSKNQAARAQDRKLSQVDQKYKKRAEDLLHGELAVALGIEPEQVEEYICRALEKDK